MAKTHRRLVTGQTGDGTSVFVSDEQISPVRLSNWPPDTGVTKVWGSNSPPTLPIDGNQYDYDTIFPPPGGFRFELVTHWPESWSTETLTAEQRSAEIDAKLPGLMTGAHATPSIDIAIVTEGEIWLELDEGDERFLRTGDTVVLNGGNHTWHNRSDELCTTAVVLLGAERAEGA